MIAEVPGGPGQDQHRAVGRNRLGHAQVQAPRLDAVVLHGPPGQLVAPGSRIVEFPFTVSGEGAGELRGAPRESGDGAGDGLLGER